jgi:hypothetical protein
MPDPVNGYGKQLIPLVNQECGYKNVYVDNNTTARWSNKGNLVVEQNNTGDQCTCKDGMVINRQRMTNSNMPKDPIRLPPREVEYDPQPTVVVRSNSN